MTAYEQVGGVRGAVARLAEPAYERLEAEQRDGRASDPAAARTGDGEGDAVVRRRVAARRAARATASPRSSTCSPTTGW